MELEISAYPDKILTIAELLQGARIETQQTNPPQIAERYLERTLNTSVRVSFCPSLLDEKQLALQPHFLVKRRFTFSVFW